MNYILTSVIIMFNAEYSIKVYIRVSIYSSIRLRCVIVELQLHFKFLKFLMILRFSLQVKFLMLLFDKKVLICKIDKITLNISSVSRINILNKIIIANKIKYFNNRDGLQYLKYPAQETDMQEEKIHFVFNIFIFTLKIKLYNEERNKI